MHVQAVFLYLASMLCVRRSMVRSGGKVVAVALWARRWHTPYRSVFQSMRPNPLRRLLKTIRSKNMDSIICVSFICKARKALSRRAFRQWYPTPGNWILQLGSNLNKIQKQTKCATRYETSAFQYQAKHKNNLWWKKEKLPFALKLANVWLISFWALFSM
jgi:hypothetical protein